MTLQACQNSASSLLVNIRVDCCVAVAFMHVTFDSVLKGLCCTHIKTVCVETMTCP